MVFKVRHPLTFISILLVLLLASIASGQVLKGSISGTATDPQGAVLAGAQVKATNLATGAVLTTTTDSSGLFRFNLIPAGEYKVETSAPGFRTAVQNNVAVIAGRDSGLGAIKLQVGDTTTTVEVTAAAPLIESTQSQVTNTFAGAILATAAGVQENQGLDNLALFVPGVTSVRDNAFSNTNGGQGFSVNGLRGRNNDQQIDGQNNNDNSVAGPGLFVSDTEFVGQYVLITNQFGPEYGRNAGSVVNIITKSGGNTWHGSVYGNENNSVMNSMSNFQKNFATDAAGNPLRHPPRMNDEFTGATIGGPWVKNKLFLFGGFNNEIISTTQPVSSSNLTPTPNGIATLSACFPGSASIAALAKFGPYGISGGNPFPISPSPQTVTGCAAPVEMGGVTRVISTPVHTYDFVTRADLQLGSDTLTGRYIYNRTTFFNLNDNGAAGYVFNEPALSQAVLASWTHNFTSRMVNEARVGFGRLNVEFGGNSIGSPELTADKLDQSLANITFSDPSLLGFGPATNLPQQRIVNTWQGQDNWNYVVGKHQLKAGVNYTYQRSPNIFLPNINGQFRFDDWSAFATNTPNRIRVANGPSSLDFREHDTFLYLGDDWKILRDLTLNLGATWTYYGQPANLFNDITTKRESNPATAFWDPSLPLSVRTFPKIDAPLNSVGPSAGFAWAPQWGGFLTGNGKTVIRGGYRYLYDPPFYNIYLNMATSAPEVFLQTLARSSASSIPMPAVPTGPNVRALLSPFLTKGVLDPRTQAQTQITPNFGPDKVHSWSLGIEREITKNSAVEARYVGNHGYNLFQTLDGNPFIADLQRDFPSLVPAGLSPCTTPQIPPAPGLPPDNTSPDFGRIQCGQGLVRLRANSGFSNYNAVQLEFRANNLFNQLTLRTGYTFSKTLDNVSEIFSTFGAGNTLFVAQNPANQVNFPGEYSFSGLDYPHSWNLLFTEQLPIFKEQHGVWGHLLGGWGFSGNYLITSGQRYTPSQFSGIAALTAAGDYYDFAYISSFAGADTARPFLGNLSAPSTSVGGFAQDVCNLFGSGTLGDPSEPVCGSMAGLAPTTLISMTALGQSCLALTNASPTCSIQPVDSNQVRFILNASTAQSVFGTPFGNTPRNPVQDAITNVANFSVFKRFKLSERAGFEIHGTLLNVFNHPNFASVDPFLEDAGLFGNSNAFSPTGFGNVKASDNVPGVIGFQGGPTEASRRIVVGGKLTF
jgi:carboxypeptidase family protein